ncbi:pyridoxal phosphate-dependent decarboxylase family protein [Nonomuraea lactucae]|uniref:pyridoxal phosphate-dependent decarboxylase family protein n=1 Tax=Nonomuraea lactucae TaxID=2249762 RepID=UPI000DE26DCD|nr:aminotransferase class I/II-fold pyridoxal phosphate-dependent enzyme [Nonomuraea lactucae]
MDLARWLGEAVSSIERWKREYGAFDVHPSLQVSDERVGEALGRLAGRLRDNYPFFHPRYAGQMLKPPHPAAIVGYVAAMQINPNNHALDGGPATADMEKELVSRLATMFGYREHLGHLTSSGTIANLEALFVARETHPGKAVAFSAASHYTHARMCGLLGMEGRPVPADGAGRMDLDALADQLSTGEIGTVVATTGTTGLGAVDQVHEIVPLARRHGARVHVDAAYGGFFTLLAAEGSPEPIDPLPWRAVAEADSIVVDPHKHGLQPYGCGAVLFRDPAAGRFYVHDSPYTYFTSDELHLGEISLECSRAGAAAAALWLTFELLPPTPEGLGRVLAAGRRAAVRWAELIESSRVLELYQRPELDIVACYPAEPTLSAVDAAARRVMEEGMRDPADPVFLSVLRVSADEMARRAPHVIADADGTRVLRSVLMKPEEETYLGTLHARVESLAREALSAA